MHYPTNTDLPTPVGKHELAPSTASIVRRSTTPFAAYAANDPRVEEATHRVE